MFAKLLTAVTVASVGGVVGVGVVNEYSASSVPAKSAAPAPVVLTAPPVIQTPPVLGQGPPPGGSDGSPVADKYALMFPGWKFWSEPVTGPVFTTGPRKKVQDASGKWGWFVPTTYTNGVTLYAYGTPGPYGLPWGNAAWVQFAPADAGGQYWKRLVPTYYNPFPGEDEPGILPP